MAKTVFGIPGVENKPEGGGGAVAPGGAPGAQSGGELPQKSGKEGSPDNPSQKEEKNKKPGLDLSGALGKVSKGPAMAKPKGPVMAKPVSAPPGAKPAGTDAQKTVFGMPAMKLPVGPGAPGAVPPQPAPPETPAAESSQTADGQGAAYNATVLGMAPADLDKPSDESKPDVPSDMGPTDEATPEPVPSESESTMTDELKEEALATAKKYPSWMLFGMAALIVLLLVIVGWIIFGSSDDAPEMTPPTPPPSETLKSPNPAQ